MFALRLLLAAACLAAAPIAETLAQAPRKLAPAPTLKTPSESFTQMISINEAGKTVTSPKMAVPAPKLEPAKAKTRLSAYDATSGIGGGGSSSLTPPAGAAWGSSSFTMPYSGTIKDPYGSATQTASGRVNGTFNVYLLKGGKYLVIYNETGIISPGKYLLNENEAKGFFQSRFSTQVRPTLPGFTDTSAPMFPNCKWTASSPSTVNQNTQHQESITSGYSSSVTIAANKDGASGSYTEGQSTQLSTSDTRSILDWGVDETTNGAQNTTSWVFHQQQPFEANDLPNFPTTYQACFDGNTVKEPTNISRTSLQYSTTTVWTFDATSAPSLQVNFQGTVSQDLSYLNTPSWEGAGHHLLFRPTFTNTWNHPMDLVQVVKQGY